MCDNARPPNRLNGRTVFKHTVFRPTVAPSSTESVHRSSLSPEEVLKQIPPSPKKEVTVRPRTTQAQTTRKTTTISLGKPASVVNPNVLIDSLPTRKLISPAAGETEISKDYECCLFPSSLLVMFTVFVVIIINILS